MKKDAPRPCDPFEDMMRLRDAMHQEMDRMLGGFLGQPERPLLSCSRAPAQGLIPYTRNMRAPVADVRETESSVVAVFEIPGAEKEDIELNVTEDAIEVKAVLKVDKEVKREDMHAYQRLSSSFYRRIPLPAEVKSDEAEATYKQGILRVEIPKVKPVQQDGKKRVLIK